MRYFIFKKWYNQPTPSPDALGAFSALPEVSSPAIAYQLVKVGTAGRVADTGNGSAAAVQQFLTTLRSQQWTDSYASLGAAMSKVEQAEVLTQTLEVTLGVVEVVSSLLPGGASTVYAIKGEWSEFKISLAGDAGYLIAGPLAKLAEARKAFRLAKASYYGGATILAGVGAERFVEGVYELRKQDGDKWAAGMYFGEAALRMFGATTAVIKGIKSAPTSVRPSSAPVASGKYSGGLAKVENPDAKADLLAKKLGGESRVKFKNDPAGREFDVVSDKYIGQTNEGKQVINQRWRNEAKATFEAAKETGRQPYFHFEKTPGADLLKKIEEYQTRYGIQAIIDVSPLKP